MVTGRSWWSDSGAFLLVSRWLHLSVIITRWHEFRSRRLQSGSAQLTQDCLRHRQMTQITKIESSTCLQSINDKYQIFFENTVLDLKQDSGTAEVMVTNLSHRCVRCMFYKHRWNVLLSADTECQGRSNQIQIWEHSVTSSTKMRSDQKVCLEQQHPE